jgi:hypothetical protein
MIDIVSDEPLFNVKYKLNDGYLDRYSHPIELGEGHFDIYFEAMDSSGNLNSSTRKIKIDLSIPATLMIVSHEPDGENGYYTTQPMIYLQPQDDNDPFVRYRWNGGDWKDYEGPLTPSIGINELEYMSTDGAGNKESPPVREIFRYDPDPPNILLRTTPDGPDGDNGFYISQPLVQVNISDDVSDSFKSAYVLVSPGSGFEWEDDATPINGQIRIPEGRWNLFIIAQDLAGNRKETTPILFKVDLTPPMLDWYITPSTPDGNNTWYVTSPNIIFNHTDDNKTIHISFDGGLQERIEGDLTLPEGVHEIVFHARDQAGNLGKIHTFSYKCDLTDPIAGIIAERRNYFVNETINISSVSSTDDGNDLIFRYYVNETVWSKWSSSSNNSFSFSQPGQVSMFVEVMDLSGRTSFSEPLLLDIIEKPVMNDSSDPNGTGIVDDPEPEPYVQSDDVRISNETILLFSAIIILSLVLSITLVTFFRKRSIREVEWESDDDWLEEDWVDEDIDDEDEELDSIYIDIWE